MKPTEILTKEEYYAVRTGGLEKWGIEGALGQDKNNFRVWWEVTGKAPCSFCREFGNFNAHRNFCPRCILWDRKAGECFKEFEDVKKAVKNNNYPAFIKASAAVYAKIVRADYDAYLKFVGADKKEPEPKKSEKDLITGISWPCYSPAFFAIYEYAVGEIAQWDGTDGDGTKLDDEQLVKLIGIRTLLKRLPYKIECLSDSNYWWYCTLSALRPLTEDELAEYYTVELDGVRYRFYKDYAGNTRFSSIELGDGHIDTSTKGQEMSDAIFQKAGIPVMPYPARKGGYKPPKEKA